MAEFWISFRIDDDADYENRYTQLIASLLEGSKRYWDETTSFIIMDHAVDIDDVARAAKNAVDERTDTVLIRQLDTKAARVVGVVNDQDLFALMPYCKRV